jgi:hypothetical protein
MTAILTRIEIPTRDDTIAALNEQSSAERRSDDFLNARIRERAVKALQCRLPASKPVIVPMYDI